MTKRIPPPSSRRPAPQSLREFLAGPPAIGQRALAEALGCHQSMVSMLVRGKRLPSARLAVRLHAVTGVPLKNLLAPRFRKPKPRTRPLTRGDPAPRTQAATP
jgi:transcriptional regulator with XRE-family HTH domain